MTCLLNPLFVKSSRVRVMNLAIYAVNFKLIQFLILKRYYLGLFLNQMIFLLIIQVIFEFVKFIESCQDKSYII